MGFIERVLGRRDGKKVTGGGQWVGKRAQSIIKT